MFRNWTKTVHALNKNSKEKKIRRKKMYWLKIEVE